MSTLKSFYVTITDVVDWTITLSADSDHVAYAQAWELFASLERDPRVRVYCDTSTKIVEVQP